MAAGPRARGSIRSLAIAGLTVYGVATGAILFGPVGYGGIVHLISDAIRAIPVVPSFG